MNSVCRPLRDAILSIDQGTTNSKAILLDHQGRIIALGSAPLAISHPQSGWVEQSGDDIWASVVDAIKECVDKAPTVSIVAIGISNQRESVLVWDASTSTPLGPVITWQCRRTTEQTEKLIADGHQEQVLAATGLPLDPLFPATKIRWLLDTHKAPERRVGTVDSWLIWKLTDGQCFATDRSNASRTQLLNVETGQWDDTLCALFGVEQHGLATVTDSKHEFGYSKNVPGVSDGVPVASAIGDSHAALFGHAAFAPGDAKATFGTGSSVMMVVPEFEIPQNGMTTTIAWSIENQITYALEGNILVSASLFPWAATLLGLDGDVDRLLLLAEQVQDSNGVALVPALVGLGAPHWNPEARGMLTGLSFTATPAHIAHAAALSMPLQAVDVFQSMRRQSAANPGHIYVDGGPTRNLWLMKQLADLLDQTIIICRDPEVSALGAGLLAGLQTGFWTSLDEVAALQRQRESIRPTMEQKQRQHILSTWSEAISACVHTARE